MRTFSARTWFCKPAPVSPLACASRGWVNAGVDALACDSCDARLRFSVPAGAPAADRAAAAARFASRLDAGHDELCPWLRKRCAPGLSAFPPLSPEAVEAQHAARAAALREAAQLLELPAVAPAALARMSQSRARCLARLLRRGPAPRAAGGLASFAAGAGGEAPADADPDADADADGEPVSAEEVNGSLEMRARLLAVCGWDIRAPGLTSELGERPPDATAAPQLRCVMCGARRVLRTR